MFLKGMRIQDLSHDLPAGFGLFLITIPIAIGYAEVAGLPPEYGLFGSILPILVFALLTRSQSMVFGIDAAPAVLTGEFLASIGVASGSEEAREIVPAVTMLAAVWLLLFALFHAEKFIKYISSVVMSGFLSGLFVSVILMRLPALFGGTPGWGNARETVPHLIHELLHHFHWQSFLFGIIPVMLLFLLHRKAPRFPAVLFILFAGIAAGWITSSPLHGVVLLETVPEGFPHITVLQIHVLSDHAAEAVYVGFSIAMTVFAESQLMLQERNLINGVRTEKNHEIYVYALSMAAAAFTGCAPVNCSDYRTKNVAALGGRTQMTSVIAAGLMAVLLLFGTSFIDYIPVPVVTAILVVVLWRSTEFEITPKLYHSDPLEFAVFWGVFAAVLLLGAEIGLFCGILLSFLLMVRRAASPRREFLGYDPVLKRFAPLGQMSGTHALRGVIIYSFQGDLFFGNIGLFGDDLEKASAGRADARVIIVNAAGIGRIDYTAAQRLVLYYRHMRRRGIRLYLTEHASGVNEELRAFGAGEMIEEGHVRPHLEDVLLQEGIEKPYPLEEAEESAPVSRGGREQRKLIAEYRWAYGNDAEKKIEDTAARIAREILRGGKLDAATLNRAERLLFGRTFRSREEEEFLDLLELAAVDLLDRGDLTEQELHELEEMFLHFQAGLDVRLREQDPAAYEEILSERTAREQDFLAGRPDKGDLLRLRKEIMQQQEAPGTSEAGRASSGGESAVSEKARASAGAGDPGTRKGHGTK